MKLSPPARMVQCELIICFDVRACTSGYLLPYENAKSSRILAVR